MRKTTKQRQGFPLRFDTDPKTAKDQRDRVEKAFRFAHEVRPGIFSLNDYVLDALLAQVKTDEIEMKRSNGRKK
jgi:hypothetical protein